MFYSKWYNTIIHSCITTYRVCLTCVIHRCKIPGTSKMEFFEEHLITGHFTLVTKRSMLDIAIELDPPLH